MTEERQWQGVHGESPAEATGEGTRKLPVAPPPEDLARVEPDLVTLKAGSTLYRIYKRAGEHPVIWPDFRHVGPLPEYRFDHHFRPKELAEMLASDLGEETIVEVLKEVEHTGFLPVEQERGILYAACGDDAVATCVAEVFKNGRTVNRKRDEPWLAAFATTTPVKLLDIRGKWTTRARASTDLNSNGDWLLTQGWSRAIHDAYPEAEGLLHASSMNGHAPAIVLYERARNALPERPRFNRPLSDPGLVERLRRICKELGYDSDLWIAL